MEMQASYVFLALCLVDLNATHPCCPSWVGGRAGGEARSIRSLEPRKTNPSPFRRSTMAACVPDRKDVRKGDVGFVASNAKAKLDNLCNFSGFPPYRRGTWYRCTRSYLWNAGRDGPDQGGNCNWLLIRVREPLIFDPPLPSCGWSNCLCLLTTLEKIPPAGGGGKRKSPTERANVCENGGEKILGGHRGTIGEKSWEQHFSFR